ncbi:hypothetical protein NG825_05880 [Xanthomonas sacchari]|nr:hypothetical protein NG825_05880 [Xanthomonas sacchari]
MTRLINQTTEVANAGEIHIILMYCVRVGTLRAVTTVDAVHSNILRCDTSIRKLARTAASNALCAWSTPKMKLAERSDNHDHTPRAVALKFPESRLRDTPMSSAMVAGTQATASRFNVHNPGLAEVAQPTTKHSKDAMGSTIRIALWKIFQRPNSESVFLTRAPEAIRTVGSNQGSSCQSPRIQRWLRREVA